MTAAATDTDGETPGRKRGGGRLKLIGIAGGVVLLIAGAGAYAAGIFGGGDADPAAGEGPLAAAPVFFHELPELLVTLNTGERRSSYLKVRVTLELADAGDAARIQQMTPRIIDYCQVYLRELRPDDLKGSAGSARLHADLLRRINLAVAPAKVRDVLFAEIFIQ